jgi:hypothetical protein
MLATSAFAAFSTQRKIAADTTTLPNQIKIFMKTPQPPKNLILRSIKDVAEIGPCKQSI